MQATPPMKNIAARLPLLKRYFRLSEDHFRSYLFRKLVWSSIGAMTLDIMSNTPFSALLANISPDKDPALRPRP